jgi:hypothetical protein
LAEVRRDEASTLRHTLRATWSFASVKTNLPANWRVRGELGRDVLAENQASEKFAVAWFLPGGLYWGLGESRPSKIWDRKQASTLWQPTHVQNLLQFYVQPFLR